MSRSAVQDATVMGRPPAENPKSAVLNFRVHDVVRAEVERLAREEKRTVASMADLLIREAIVGRLKRSKRDASEIESLP